MRAHVALLLLALLIPAANLAAQAQNPVADALRSNLERSQRNLVAAAEAMPAGKYGFKPTPGHMSFGQLMLHVAQTNEFLCSHLSSGKAPDEPKLEATTPKDQLVARLKRSFDYCTTSLKDANDSALGDSLEFFGGRKMTRAGMMMNLAGDWTDHYSAAATYLRLNGILPPTAKKSM
jgi:uncharacterized damage-inducible protein DinB